MQYDPVCWVDGATYGNACSAWCEWVEIAYVWACEFGVPGECARWYTWEVCGSDGRTYDDACDLEAAWVEKAYDGWCVAEPWFWWVVDAPAFCTSWYDGCNECGIENGFLSACTERACFTMNRAHCTAFAFTLVTPWHERLIEDVVSKRKSDASAQQIEEIVAKVTEKIDEINYTLSVSSFVQWSEVLEVFQFTLEVLWKIDSVL
jgi:hypothetical protein